MRIRLPWMATKRFTIALVIAMCASTSVLAADPTLDFTDATFSSLEWAPIKLRGGENVHETGLRPPEYPGNPDDPDYPHAIGYPGGDNEPALDVDSTKAYGDLFGHHAQTYPMLSSLYDDQGTPAEDDDQIAYRIRVRSNSDKGVTMIGIDADTDGRVDIFIGANAIAANADGVECITGGIVCKIQFYTSGNRTDTFLFSEEYNRIPGQTYKSLIDSNTVGTGGSKMEFLQDTGFQYEYLSTANNYKFQAVSADAALGSFISINFPFNTLKALLGKIKNPIAITKDSPFQYIVLTGETGESINDLGGLDNDLTKKLVDEEIEKFDDTTGTYIKKKKTYLDLGIMSYVYSQGGTQLTDDPVALPQTLMTAQRTVKNITLSGRAPNSIKTYTIVDQPSNGSLSFTGT